MQPMEIEVNAADGSDIRVVNHRGGSRPMGKVVRSVHRTRSSATLVLSGEGVIAVLVLDCVLLAVLFAGGGVATMATTEWHGRRLLR